MHQLPTGSNRRAEETVPRSLSVCANHLPQLSNSSLKSTPFTLVVLVSGHLALESLEPGYGFDYEGHACGWSNAGDEMPHRHRI